ARCSERGFAPSLDKQSGGCGWFEDHSSRACADPRRAVRLPFCVQVDADIAGYAGKFGKTLNAAGNGAVHVQEYDGRVGVAAHGITDLVSFAHGVDLPPAVVLSALYEIVRGAELIEVLAQRVPPMPVIRCEPSANDEVARLRF